MSVVSPEALGALFAGVSVEMLNALFYPQNLA
jgi:hypothetical protein